MIGVDGKTAWERRRREKCTNKLAMIGEKVLYLPLKTAKVHQQRLEPNMFEGIWLGINARTEEAFIGTDKGVVKCRTIKHLPEEEKWNAELVNFMKGTTWQPLPVSKSDQAPVEINDDGSTPPGEEEDGDFIEYSPVAMEDDIDKYQRFRHRGADDVRVHVRNTDKYGFILGCRACA